MRMNRKFLYWGVFLVALGGVLVAADVNGVDDATIGDALRLWPLAIVALGLGLVLRRTRFSVAGGLLAAAVPGLVLGGMFAVVPHFTFDCSGGGEASSFATRNGTFDGPARVDVTTGCGSLVVTTAPGPGWHLETSNTADRGPAIATTSTSLSVDAGGHGGWHGFDAGRDVWRLSLPTSAIDDLSLVVNAGEGRIDLPGAQVGNLRLTTNAGKTTVDMSAASVASLSGTVNAGELSMELPAASDLSASMAINAGTLRVCAPSGLGLLVHHTGVLNGVAYRGLQQTGNDWQSPDYASAAHHADLTVSVNLGSVDINPIGGCK